MNHPEVVRLDYPAADIKMLARNPTEATWRANCTAKEPWTAEWLSNIPAGAVVLDAGANVGSYTLIAAARGLQVIAIEPAYTNVHSLCENLKINQMLGAVLVVHGALGAETKLDLFQFASMASGAASHAMGRQPGGVAKWWHQQPVMVWRLDDLCGVFKVPVPTFIKIDIDGGEMEALKGMPQVLALVQGMMIEVRTEQEAAATELLAGYGLTVKARFDQRGGKPLGGIAYLELVRSAGLPMAVESPEPEAVAVTV